MAQSCSANDGIRPASLDSFVLCEQLRGHFQKAKWDSPLLWSYGLSFGTTGRAEGCLHQHHHGHMGNASRCGYYAPGGRNFSAALPSYGTAVIYVVPCGPQCHYVVLTTVASVWQAGSYKQVTQGQLHGWLDLHLQRLSSFPNWSHHKSHSFCHFLAYNYYLNYLMVFYFNLFNKNYF